MYQASVTRRVDVFHPEVLTFSKRLIVSKIILLKGKLSLLRTDTSIANHSNINISTWKFYKFYITKFTRAKYVAAISQLLRTSICNIPVWVMNCYMCHAYAPTYEIKDSMKIVLRMEWKKRSGEPFLFVLLNIYHFLRYYHSSFSMFEKFEPFIIKLNSLKAAAV